MSAVNSHPPTVVVSSRRILWVDDYAGENARGFMRIMHFVRQRGHDITIATTPESIAEEIDRIAAYDLLILDILMPPMPFATDRGSALGGLDVLESLEYRRLGAGPSVPPVLVFSLLSEHDLREEAAFRSLSLEGAGVVGILQKGSILPEALADRVQSVLEAG